MSDELKSAFEIKGFLEGECDIERQNGLYKYKFYLEARSILCLKKGVWVDTCSPLNWFLEEKFKKVEPKKKMYIHEYWAKEGSNFHYKKVRTLWKWDSYKVDSSELIKTTEIEE